MSDYDLQFQADLEKAQALSLESLALDQFRRQKSTNTVSYASEDGNEWPASVCTESDYSMSALVPEIPALPPPPRRQSRTSQQRVDHSSTMIGTEDLISFTNPESKKESESFEQYINQIHNMTKRTEEISLASNIVNSNIHSNNSVKYTSDYMHGQAATSKPYPPYPAYCSPTPEHFSSLFPRPPLQLYQNMTRLVGPTQTAPLMSNTRFTGPTTNISSFRSVDNNLSISSTTDLQNNMTPQNSSHPDFSRRMSELSNLSEMSSECYDTVASLPNSLNLIDFASGQVGYTDCRVGSVRVSVLEAFDPLLDQNAAVEYMGPSEGSSSVYDEYDPLDFLYGETEMRESAMYATISKKDCAPATTPPPLSSPPPLHIHTALAQHKLYDSIELLRVKNYDAELIDFLEKIKEIRGKYKYDDMTTNPGYVIAPHTASKYPPNTSIKLLVYHSNPDDPVMFTCDVESTIEHVIMHVICELDGEFTDDMTKYMLRVWGLAQYLTPGSCLRDYDYIRVCVRLEKDVRLVVVCREREAVLSRVSQDDVRASLLTLDDLLHDSAAPTSLLSYDNLNILLETLEGELSRAVGVTSAEGSCQPSAVVQAVKAICALAGRVETLHVTHTLAAFSHACAPPLPPSQNRMRPEISSDGEGACSQYSRVTLRSATTRDNVRQHCQRVRDAVRSLLQLYARTHQVDFQLTDQLDNTQTTTKEAVSMRCVRECLLVCVEAVHRPLCEWRHEEFLVQAQVYHGTRPLKGYRLTQLTNTETSGFYPRILFDTWLNLEEVAISTLPREARLVLTLYGRTASRDDNRRDAERGRESVSDSELAEKEAELAEQLAVSYYQQELGWAALQLFNYDGMLASGRYLLPVWPVCSDKRLGPAPHPMQAPAAPHAAIHIEVPAYTSSGVRWPLREELHRPCSVAKPENRDFESLDAHTQLQLLHLVEQGAYQRMPIEGREILWEKRQYLVDIPGALPLVLLAATSWDLEHREQLMCLVRKWKTPSPFNALHLLLPCFPDREVGEMAVECLREMSDDTLCGVMPQLVQALRHETQEGGALACALLERSVRAPAVAHRLYWLLLHALPQNWSNDWLGENVETAQASDVADKEADVSQFMADRWRRRYQLLLRALLAMVGVNLENRLLRQQSLVKEITDIANAVKTCKEGARNRTLAAGVQQLARLARDGAVALPLALSTEVHDLDTKSCSYFASNTLPLKINFIGNDNAVLPAMFKVGDDLRQDALVLQVMRVMDGLWLKEELDLRMVTFQAVPTQHRKGMIEIVTEAETLRAIQTEWGLTGSFKDRPIAEWLAKHNPSELEYERARDNFTASCAGYSVATYLLGICDRHNDNIMLKTSGHLFHIDFGKFLGDAQMFGNFKRDRAPFVLTPDMAYVINGGERPSQRFHYFVELCCTAFNIVRRHHDHILDLFALMATSGVAGVSMGAVSYVRAALLPGATQAEAAAAFARLIHSSLKSKFTPINFFLHNLAQLRAAGGEASPCELLSFMPRTYTMAQEGRLLSVEVLGFEKRYDPEKHYVYSLRIYRLGQVTPFVLYRSYKHFTEFYQKLCLHFPLAKVHSLPISLHVGRSAVRQVAERRYSDVQAFLTSLFALADEIAHSDLVYTFFHPLLRDQQDAKPQRTKHKEEASDHDNSGSGSIKISVQYAAGVLSVLILHAQSLALTPQGLPPNAYVKVYLLPDPSKETKRKTRVLKRNSHPSFMEMLEYRMPMEVVRSRTLQATVWHYDSLQENTFLGGVVLPLSSLTLHQETVGWYPLEYIPR